MKKIVLFTVFTVLTLGSCGKKTDTEDQTSNELVAKPKPPVAEGTVRVLFVGNSHTEYFVSFPRILEALAKENNKSIEVKKLIEMGVNIERILAANKKEADQIFSATDTDGNYLDYIILQEATPIAIQDLAAYKVNIKTVHDLASKNSPDAATYIYGLTAPFEYNEGDYKAFQPILLENGVEAAKSLPNTGFLNFSAVLASAYQGHEEYKAIVEGKDQLRHTDSSRHMLNDAVFVNSIVLYQTLFGETPKIPQQLPLSTGISDSDTIKLMDVSKGVSNPEALLKIATSFK